MNLFGDYIIKTAITSSRSQWVNNLQMTKMLTLFDSPEKEKTIKSTCLHDKDIKCLYHWRLASLPLHEWLPCAEYSVAGKGLLNNFIIMIKGNNSMGSTSIHYSVAVCSVQWFLCTECPIMWQILLPEFHYIIKGNSQWSLLSDIIQWRVLCAENPHLDNLLCTQGPAMWKMFSRVFTNIIKVNNPMEHR